MEEGDPQLSQTPSIPILVLPGASLSFGNIVRSPWEADLLLPCDMGPLNLMAGNE